MPKEETPITNNQSQEIRHENNLGKTILTAAGVTAAVAGAAGAAMYGINKAKENNDLEEEPVEEDIDDEE